MTTSRLKFLAAACVFLLLAGHLPAQSSSNLPHKIQQIMDRPEFQHATFGIEFLSLDTGKVIYALNADKLFASGSTTKLLTEGTALGLLGPVARALAHVYFHHEHPMIPVP